MVQTEKDIRKLLKELDQPKVILLKFQNVKHLDEEIAKIIKILVNEKHLKGIYVTIRNPSNYMIDIFKKNGIDVSMILFLDVISKYIYISTPGISIPTEINTEEYKNVILLKSPVNLTELGLVFLEISASFRKNEKCFVFLDSLDALSLYIEKEKFLKFFHFLVSKLKLFRIIGVFSQVSDREDMIEDIKYLVDEIFTIQQE